MRGTRKDYTHPTRVEVLNLVQAYLDAPQRESDGGFAEVPEGDVAELDALILALIKYRYEPDPDGDRPIRWSLCDWTRQDPHQFVHLPKMEDDESNIERVFDKALLNMAMASSEVQRLQQIRFWKRQDEKAK